MTTNYAEKKQARIDRYNELAEKNHNKAGQLINQAHKMADAIPFGQPILVGHRSEQRDRNYRGKIDRTYQKSFETYDKAQYYEQRAAAAENNNAISSDDPEALDKLREKLAGLEKLQEQMKQLNKIIKSRKKGYSQEDKIRDIIDLGYSETTANKLFTPDFCGRIGFASYQLTNNNANIRRIKGRIEKLEKMSIQETTKTQISGDITIIDNVEENRIQVFFPGKPDEEIRKKLKSQSFRWSPSNGCWQSYRGSWRLERIISILSN